MADMIKKDGIRIDAIFLLYVGGYSASPPSPSPKPAGPPPLALRLTIMFVALSRMHSVCGWIYVVFMIVSI